VHVGYGKTGSSYLQALLRRRRDDLWQQGVFYPSPPEGDRGDSGNGSLLLGLVAAGAPLRLPGGISPAEAEDLRGLLFSREQLARELSEPQACEALARWASAHGLWPVRVLMFLRDPQEHCYSLWAQKVKRARETRSLQQFADAYDATRMVTRFVRQASSAGFELCVQDYGAARDSLLEVFAHWLGVTFEGLEEEEKKKRVNITPGDLALRLQRRLNGWKPGWQLPPPLQEALRGSGSIIFPNELLARWRGECDELTAALQQAGVEGPGIPFTPGPLLSRGSIRLDPR
jgi:hypothetical protein